MEKTYKRVSFDIELAKKIQAGEVEGKIKTTQKKNVRIVCWDRMDTETPILFLVQFDNWEEVFECNVKGEYIEGYGDDARERQLVLEVPDNEPQFKPFDKVLVRNCEHWEWEPAIFSKKDGIMYVTTGDIYWNYCIPYEGNEYLTGTTNKPKEN